MVIGLNAATIVNDPFTDGSRTNATGGDPQGLVYYLGQTSTVVTVTNDTVGLGSGNALWVVPNGDYAIILGQFNPVTLTDPGDFIRVSFDFRFTGAPSNASSALRMGLYDTQMTRTTSDTSSTARNDDLGYGAYINPGTTGNNLSVFSENAGNEILGGASPAHVAGFGTAGGSTNCGMTKHTLSLQIIRQTNGDLTFTAQLDAMASATGTVAAASVLTYRFDEFAIGDAGSAIRTPFMMDNLLITATADDFDRLRKKWFNFLTGGTNYNLSDPLVITAIKNITNSANGSWSSMDKTTNRTYLWSDAASTANSAQLTTCYNRILAMALGYATYGSSLRSNATLAADIASGLDWMYTNRYNETKSQYGNWWDWQIGVPMALHDTCILMYEYLTPTQLASYAKASTKFTPAPSMTGANLMWTLRGVAVRSVFMEDIPSMIKCRDSNSLIFPYVTSSDGFYTDGSFIQHGNHPYTAGYGSSLLATVAPILPWLKDSAWEVTDPAQTNVINWIFDSFAPIVYRGAAMDIVRGREISRNYGDHSTGHGIIANVFRIAQFAAPADSVRIKSLVKYWALADTAHSFPSTVALPMIGLAEQLLADTNVVPAAEPVYHKQFPNMDRVIHLRPGYGFVLNYCSKRIYNFESINGENLHAWFNGYGMTFLYNSDLLHYNDYFWPTVDPMRLPGVTTDQWARPDGIYANAYSQSSLGSSNWTGGAVLDNTFGVAGMELRVYGSSLTGRKSWFMFDDEVAALGAGITCSSNVVETTVENRRLSGTGTNDLVVNGTLMPATLGWSTNLANVAWCFLNGAGGYYFPTPTNLNAVREARTGSLFQINTNQSTNPITRNYLTLWRNHGTGPTNAAYDYVLLPNKSVTEVSNYASAPRVQIVENSSQAQAVRETNLNILAANFWGTSAKTVDYLTCNNRASVIAQENAYRVSVGVSDPTQTNTGNMVVTLNRSAVAVLSCDTNITVSQLSPTVQLNVNVKGLRGQTVHALLAYSTNTPPIINLTAPTNGSFWYGGPITLSASATDYDPGGSVVKVEFFADGSKLGEDTSMPWQFTWTNPPGGFHTLTARATDNKGLTADAAAIGIEVFPSPWQNQDVGATGLTGDSQYSNATFTIIGAGSDIWSTADGMQFVWQPRTGDGVLTARIVSLTPTDPWSKAGVMMRETLDAGARNACTLLSISNGPVFQRRYATNGASYNSTTTKIPAPYWVRLTRNSTNFTGQTSADGTNWTTLNTAVITNCAAQLYWGLAVTAHNTGLLNTSVVDNVWVNSTPVAAALTNWALGAGQVLQITNPITDADIPLQSLTFTLLNSPSNAVLDVSGLLSWRPTVKQANTTNLFRLKAVDNGQPVLAATQSFYVTVPLLSTSRLGAMTFTNGKFTLRIQGDTGPDYSIRVSTNCVDWSPLPTNNGPGYWTDLAATNYSRRFYRVLLGP